jgi:energy-coupling factor transport system ATP-binding protein
MIRLDGVRFAHLPGGPEALAGVSLAVGDGEQVAVLGRNGSGKSTLARVLNGLYRPAAGSVRVDGLDPSDPVDLPGVRRLVQLVFQAPENQQVGTTVFDDIAFGLANLGVATAEMPGRVRAALADVGLEIGFERELDTLSGGELQRLALAGVAALRPRHLVLDEATSMLDPASRRQVLASVRRLRSRHGMAVVQITHDLDELDGVDRVVVLDAGAVVAQGPVDEVLRDGDLLEACGLEAPYRWRRPGRPRGGGAPAVPPSPPIVELDAVSHDYTVPPRRRGRRRPEPALRDPVLREVDLRIAPGELVALAGRSGAGKSTLVGIAKGLLRPTLGTVVVAGREAAGSRQPDLFDQIGYLFQQPEHQLFAPTVRADVGFALRTGSLPPGERAARVDAALRRLGLDPDEVGERSPFGLSGGQQRRVAFAGVLVAEPTVLILDEPSAGLDLPSRRALFATLRQARERGLAVVWISHRLGEILEHAQRLVVLERGAIVADGDPAGLLSDPVLRSAMGWPLLDELDPEVAEGEARSTPPPAVAQEVA